MSRDHRKLEVVHLADDLVSSIYAATVDFPASERYGLPGPLRRAAALDGHEYR